MLAYIAKFFKNHAFNFRAFGRKPQMVGKIFEEKSIEKNDSPTKSGKVVAINRALENNTRFLQHFSDFGGRGRSRVPPPSRRLCVKLQHSFFPINFSLMQRDCSDCIDLSIIFSLLLFTKLGD